MISLSNYYCILIILTVIVKAALAAATEGVVFFEDAGLITGQIFHVDGGRTRSGA